MKFTKNMIQSIKDEVERCSGKVELSDEDMVHVAGGRYMTEDEYAVAMADTYALDAMINMGRSDLALKYQEALQRYIDYITGLPDDAPEEIYDRSKWL